MFKVIEYMAPHKALAKQKCYLHHQCCKPKDMKTHVFVNHLAHINDLEISLLPPRYNAMQSLPDDEIVDIIVNIIPRKWMREMD